MWLAQGRFLDKYRPSSASRFRLWTELSATKQHKGETVDKYQERIEIKWNPLSDLTELKKKNLFFPLSLHRIDHDLNQNKNNTNSDWIQVKSSMSYLMVRVRYVLDRAAVASWRVDLIYWKKWTPISGVGVIPRVLLTTGKERSGEKLRSLCFVKTVGNWWLVTRPSRPWVNGGAGPLGMLPPSQTAPAGGGVVRSDPLARRNHSPATPARSSAMRERREMTRDDLSPPHTIRFSPDATANCASNPPFTHEQLIV